MPDLPEYFPDSIKIPNYFLKKVKSWQLLNHFQVKNDSLLVSLAINSVDDRLKAASDNLLKSINDENVKLLNRWLQKGLIHPESRGFPKS